MRQSRDGPDESVPLGLAGDVKAGLQDIGGKLLAGEGPSVWDQSVNNQLPASQKAASFAAGERVRAVPEGSIPH